VKVSDLIESQTDGVDASKKCVYLICAVAALGGFLFGYDVAVISSTQILVQKHFSLSPGMLGFATGSAMIGCLLGPVLGSSMSDRVGHRRSLLLTAVFAAIGAVGVASAREMVAFSAFRILSGAGLGLALVVSPMYIAEVAPARVRGTLVTMNQMAIVVGVVVSYVVSYFLSLSGGPAIWRWLFALECLPAAFLAIGLTSVPESPRWLAMKGRAEDALAVLIRIGGRKNADSEMAEIMASLSQEAWSLRALISPGIRTAFLMAICLAVLQQSTGASPLSYFAPTIFRKAGFGMTSTAVLMALVKSISDLIWTIPALLLVDRLGRRPLLLGGITVMGVGLMCMGFFFRSHLSGVYVVATMMLVSAAYSMSLAPLTWLIMSEILPNRMRGHAMAVAAIALWVTAFVCTTAVPPLIHYFEAATGSGAGIFWIFALVNAGAFIFCLKMVPETKGRTLEQIGKSWTG
jgi:sugar porter (SP) family MFS transporter